MKKRICSVLLVLVLILVVLLPTAQAVGGGIVEQGIREISKTQYNVAPGVTEYEWLLNNSSLTEQMVGHVMEVKVGSGSTASIAVGYGDDNIESIASGRNWAMTETTKQAQSMQTRRDINVVGAINAGGYDMSNGRPGGAFIMSGTQINAPTGTTFWIDKSGAAHITSAQECNAAFAAGNVMEAVASFGDIFENGHARSGLDDITRASRTAIGIKADGTVVMFMVNGRQAPYSVGMTMAEVAAAMEDLGCVQAVNLDGGGSSTFATQREGEPDENSTSAGLTLRCRPSDGYERKVSNTVMVLSTAKPTGLFDHAVLTPNDEVYTPGSTVQFTATGVDAAGGKAEIPAGASWAVLSGNGRIDANGLYTAAGTCGEVEVGLKAGGKTVGKTTIQVQWPDKLGFTNTSVSIDFGQTSDLTFKPTWRGREVHYKNRDFTWSVDPTYYKFDALVDPKTNNTKGDFSMAITPDTLGKDTVVVEYYAWGTSLTYTSTYRVTELVPSTEDGAIKITAKVVYVSSGGAAGEKKPTNLEQTFSAYIGRFSGNKFVADEKSSLRGTIHVALANDPTVNGAVDVAVGMEPFVLMDFEDHGGVAATEYWSTHVGSSSAGGSGQLLPEEVKNDRLWIRDTTGKGVIFPEGYNRIVGAEEDENVRFGQYAFKLGYNFEKTDLTVVAAADFGFSGDLLVNTTQPTRIGMWIKVPTACAGDKSVLKADLKGGAFEANLDTAYMKFNDDGSISYVDGKQLNGTAAYVQYYSYNADGTVSGSTLSDWAGKDWTWVEADISAFQMPVDVCRAYTVRVTSPQNCTKSSGYLYIDNLQFIYGTNTNDVTRPVLESITETGSGTVLDAGGTTVLPSGNLSFSAVYSDSELTDKYATGIDTSGIRVLLDGTDYTGKLEINDGSLYLKGVNLRNGTHTLTVRLKDFYGNVTTETRTFRVENTEGVRSAVDIVPQPEAPEIGKEYVFAIVNNTGETVTKAELTVDFSAMGNAAKYLTGATVESLGNYNLTLDQNALAKGLAKITVTKQTVQARRAMLTSAQDTDYNYVSELGYLIIKIPENAASDSELRCTVTQGSYTVVDSNGTETAYTFSGEEKAIPLKADYQLNCEQAIVGMPAELTVTDADGKPISRADIYQVSSDGSQRLGGTNMKGTFTKTFDTAGEYIFYAEKTGSGRSWNQRVIVCEKTAENSGKPFGILTNGVTVPGTKSITWITQIDGSAAKAQVKYSTSNDLSEAAVVDGTSALQTFVQSSHGDALRSNQVTLTGLTPGTTYYYQVGDGTTWSDKQSFKMPAANAEATNFFILGDIQSSDTSILAHVLDVLKTSETAYDFALQTGDAIDNVTEYVKNWRPFLTTVNSDKLNGVDLIHVLGNHEYYGDADGKISKAIYDLPESTQNSWYKLEYGKVCVVVVNNGTKLSEALADIAENLTTDCVWKVLVAHEPIYGTEAVSATPEILASIEKAGFDFVFGGDDHAYARTYPMLGGQAQAEDSRKGVVYYVCGDLSSKSNEFHNRDIYANAIAHNDYGGMYLTVQATDAAFTVKAVKYDGTELDSYTKTRTDCEQGKHTINGSSLYDMASHKVQCVVCEQYVSVPDTFSQLLTTTDQKSVILVNGKPLTKVFRQFGETMYHACADGYAYVATAKYNGTCTTSGTTTYTCPSCAATYNTPAQMPNGHQWDGNHICTVCGFHGIDISSSAVDVQLGTPEKPIGKDAVGYRYNYNPNGTIPYFYAKYGDTLLSSSRGDGLVNGKIVDLFIAYQNNKQVGKATVQISGRGDYYGEVELHYYIYPKAPSGLKASKVMDTYAKLTWGISSGADSYELHRYDSASGKYVFFKNVGNTTGCTVTELDMQSTYYFIVRGTRTVDGQAYTSGWSNALKVTTNAASADVQTVTASVDDQSIGLSDVNGTQYLFLPASADLTKLPLRFEASENKGALVLSGDKSSLTLDAAEQSVDLTALASETDGCYVVTARIGGGDALTVRVMQGTGIPTLYLTSDDENQARVWVDAAKTNKATGTALMTSATGTTLYNGALKQIKARGNSTFLHTEKKSYQIKLSSGADLLGTGEQVKTWVLLAGYFDATQMHDKLVKDLAAQLGMSYTASCGWVNLYYDGEYRGVYLLSEKNDISKTSVNINDLEKQYELLNKDYGTGMVTAEGKNSFGNTVRYTTNVQDPWAAKDSTGGYLLEMNYHTMEEASCFMTSQGYAINVKSPEWCGKGAMDYISEFYQGFEDAVYASDASGRNSEGKYYYDYVDLDSLVRTFVLQELAKNCDGFRYSQFFYFTNGKLYAGPVWDQEMTFGSGWSGYSRPDSMEYFDLGKALIRIPHFKAAVQAYYSTFRSAANGLESRISAQYAALNDSAAMNYTLWPYIRVGNPEAAGHIWQGASYGSVINDLQSWIAKRLSKLDEVYADIPAVTRGDVNGDGKVSMMDLLVLRKYLAGITELTETQMKAADVNNDGKVSMMDVLWLRQYLAGLRDENFEKINV